MILIFVEDTYSHSGWCQDLVNGLVSELKMKRMAFRFIRSIEEMSQGSGYIYVIGSSTGWIRTVLKDANRVGIYPILLCNQAFHELDVRYSTVCSDTNGSMHHLVDTLIATGRTRIALYGTNPHSVSDESRKKAFYYAIGQKNQRDVYINDGSMERCFRSFQGTMADYDAVICANDFTAISLVRNLLAGYPQELERLLIIGCAETSLTEYYSPYILSIRVNFQEYGKAAVTLLENLKRNPYLSHAVMSIRWDFSPLTSLRKPDGGTRDSCPPSIPESRDIFYQDAELTGMLRLERMLNECDSLDREIIYCLLREESYDNISENCFVTISTIKYRVKKMIGLAEAADRRGLIRLLREYLPQADKNGNG